MRSMNRTVLISFACVVFIVIGCHNPAMAQRQQECSADVVFIMDTSFSMDDEAVVLCDNITQIVLDLGALGVQVNASYLGIMSPGYGCLTDTVFNLFGDAVPGNPPCCPIINDLEDWAPASAIISDRYPWNPDLATIRLIVTMSDEAPLGGDPCNDPGDDRDAIEHAITIANSNWVFVSPITCAGADACTLQLAARLANGTGGVTFQSTDPNSDLVDAIANIVLSACDSSAPCCFQDETCAVVPQFICEDVGGTEVDICLGDSDNDGFDDACVPPVVPTLPKWGLAMLIILLLGSAALRIIR